MSDEQEALNKILSYMNPERPFDDQVQYLINKAAREVADDMAKILRQEYKQVDGEWWLWSLGEPRRPLTEEEVAYAKERGLIVE